MICFIQSIGLSYFFRHQALSQKLDPDLKQARLSDQAKRIDDVIERVGGTLKAAELVGGHRGTILKWRKGEARLPLDEASTLAKAAGVSLDWIATGINSADDDGVLIPRYDATPDGQPLARPNDVDTITVHRDFFPQNRLAANSTGIVRVTGNAMAPSLPDGTLAILDMRVKLFQDDGVYVMGHPNGFIVRRVSIRGERAYFKTDNPAHGDTYAAPEDMLTVPIWGRVALTLTRV